MVDFKSNERSKLDKGNKNHEEISKMKKKEESSRSYKETKQYR